MMKHFAGMVYSEDIFFEGYIGIEHGIVKRIGKGQCPFKPEVRGTILPSFFNSHTHVGDSAIRLKPGRKYTIEELVAPPNGLKHMMLTSMSKSKILNGIQKSLYTMISTGTTHFTDFREGGSGGVSLLKRALGKKQPSCTILGRPLELEYNKQEINALLDKCDGLGLSAISDWDYSELQKVASHTRREGKLFAIHASERVREDIDQILDLKPAFLVHMLEATNDDLKRCTDSGLPIVICPRSNAFYGRRTPFRRMLDAGCTLMLGTDNGMTSSPDMWKEATYLSSLKGFNKKAGLLKILEMACVNPRKALNNVVGLGIAEGAPAHFQVIGRKADTWALACGKTPQVVYVQSGKNHWRLHQ